MFNSNNTVINNSSGVILKFHKALVLLVLILSLSLFVHSQKEAPIQQPLIDLIQKLSLDQRKNLVHILMESMTQKEDSFRNDWNCPNTCRGYNGKCMAGCTLATVQQYDCDNICRDYHGKCMPGCEGDYNPWVCPDTCRGYNGKCERGCTAAK